MIEWNKVIYDDCMNEENGLPTLEDKSIDLCLTDPPYNVSLKKKNKENYQDDNRKYKKWCTHWFKEIERCCNRIFIQIGFVNLSMWVNIKEPFGILYDKSSGSPSRIAYINHLNPIFIYNNPNIIFDCNPINIKYKNRSLSHSCPVNYRLWDYLLFKLKPSSVIDPFMGSGTTAEACTRLGIPWIGYEKMKEYSIDINKRLKNLKKEPTQITLF